MNITNDIKYIGVNDHKIDLFEGQYIVPNGMAYNSYAIIDEKIAIMDTVDVNFTHEWMDNVQNTIGSRKPDYLIVQHMEPDHSANILNFIKVYPDTTVVASEKAFRMMKNFFGNEFENNRMVIKEGDILSLGKHNLLFVAAPMVHWPEVMATYDMTDKVLFSADGFGKFGALDVEEDWTCEARRYYIGIVGKYGVQVQNLLKKVTGLDVKDFELLCSLNLFNPTRMNDAIFKFKRYEDTSLSYTGVDRHAGEAVGGWDTVIRREEYERLFASQQETMTSGLRTTTVAEPIVAVTKREPAKKERPIDLDTPLPLTQVVPELKNKPQVVTKPAEPEFIPPHVEVGTVVIHKMFGEGTISWIQQSKKYIYVKFAGKGDKTFVYPDAFKQGFLTVKE